MHGKKILFISICCTSHLSDLTLKDEEFRVIRKTRYIYTTCRINIFFSRQIIQPSIPLIVHAYEILVILFQLPDTCCQLLHNLVKNSDKWKITLVSFYATVCKQRLCSLFPYTAVFKHVPLCEIGIISFYTYPIE